MISLRPFQTEGVLQRTILNLIKMARSFPKGEKTLLKKEKLFVARNYTYFVTCKCFDCLPLCQVQNFVVW